MPDNTETSPHSSEDDRFSRLDSAEYDRVNEFLQDHVTFTAREWAIAGCVPISGQRQVSR